MLVDSAIVDQQQQRSRLRVRGGFPFARGTDRNASGFEDDGNTEQMKGHSRKNEKRRGFFSKIWGALHPRIRPAPAINLAIARIILMTIALIETPSSSESLLLGHSASTIHTGTCTGLPAWTGWTNWRTLDLASVAGWELKWLHRAILLGMTGLATNLSVGVAGVLFIRYYVSQPAMGFVIGHPVLWLGPVMLLMAASPCGDAFSLDSAIFWAFKSRFSSSKRSPRRPGQSSWTLFWNEMVQNGQRTCYRYSIPFALMASFIGLVLMSAGYQKAKTGTYPLFSWAFSDVMLIEMRTGWLKHMGRLYVPTLAQAGWNPFRVIFHSFLLPVIRIDKLPILLHIGSEIAMIWECVHIFLLFASPAVRYAAIAMDIKFHLGVSWFIGIPIFMPMAMAHLMFLPWSEILRFRSVSHSSTSPVPKKDLESSEPASGIHGSPSKGGRADCCGVEVAAHHTSCLGRNLAIFLTLLIGVPVLFFQARLTLRGGPMHCHPFDAYPGFGYKTALRVWENEPRLPDGGVNWGRYSSLTRSRRIAVTYTNGTTVETPMLRLLCDIEGHSPCILSADLYLNNRAHSDTYLAWRQGTFWPFVAAKAHDRPPRDAFWRLAALIAASPKALNTTSRDEIAYLSFLVNGNARVDFDHTFEETVMLKLTCEVVVRSTNSKIRDSVKPPWPCDSDKDKPQFQALDVDFAAGKMCEDTPGVLKPVKEAICGDWSALGYELVEHRV